MVPVCLWHKKEVAVNVKLTEHQASSLQGRALEPIELGCKGGVPSLFQSFAESKVSFQEIEGIDRRAECQL